MPHNSALLLAFAASLALGPLTSSAVSLRPGKTTDASVCDLGPDTTTFLGQQVLVPATANGNDKISAYVRLAGAFVAEHCSNGQLLLLQGSTDLPSDGPALNEVASSSCMVADIRRSEGRASNGPYTYGTFELKCPISKLEQFRAKLQGLEAQDPMTALKARLAAAGSAPPGGAASTSKPEKKDCDKATLGTLLLGGSCK